MQINEFVDEILKKRNAKVPVIQRKRKEISEMLKALDGFDDLKSQVIDPDGNILNGNYGYILQKDPGIAIKLAALCTDECREKAALALQECDKVERRFSRDRIHISVVGQARIGKSQLLQSITDLDSRVIPTSDLTDCTGAVSIIENDPAMAPGDVRATVTFKTEKQVVEIVQRYLDTMIKEPANKLYVHSLQQIRQLNMKDIESRMNKHSAAGDKKKHLKQYIEKYNDWAGLVGSDPIVLTDAEQIQAYVAQHNGEEHNTVYFNKYLAVDSCNIRCRFNYPEAGKITLLDSVGLGDTAIGIEDDMLALVKNESDAVIFLHKPLDGSGFGLRAEIGSMYDKIAESCSKWDLNHWLFWVINLHKGKNDAYCPIAMKSLLESDYAGELKEIIDVSDQKQLREEFLLPMLAHLQEHLNDIDDLYTTDLRTALDNVRKSFNSFCASAKKVMSSQAATNANILPQMQKDIALAQRHRTGMLRSLAMSEKELRNEPCDVLYKRVEGILAQMKCGDMLPSTNQIMERIIAGEDPGSVYNDCCNMVRNAVAQSFANVDSTLNELVENVKNQITEILYKDDGCRLGRIVTNADTQKPYTWMNDFTDTILDAEIYPNLRTAFQNVYSFDFSVRGFLTYEVRACMDILDPQITDGPSRLISKEGDTGTVENIRYWLDRNLREVAEELEDRLDELFSKPHRAFFAIIKEFSDKVDFTENVADEWFRLYAENYPIVWPGTYQGMAVANSAFAAWNDMMETLLDCNSRCAVLQQL